MMTMTSFDIKEVASVEATGSLWGSVISCAGTWGGVYLLYNSRVSHPTQNASCGYYAAE